MTFASLLIDTCDVLRFVPGATDAYGNPVKAWPVYLNDEPCRLTTPSGKEIKVGAEVVIADFELFLGAVDITERDRVLLDTVTYEILLVSERQNGTGAHHKECFLRAVR